MCRYGAAFHGATHARRDTFHCLLHSSRPFLSSSVFLARSPANNRPWRNGVGHPGPYPATFLALYPHPPTQAPLSPLAIPSLSLSVSPPRSAVAAVLPRPPAGFSLPFLLFAFRASSFALCIFSSCTPDFAARSRSTIFAKSPSCNWFGSVRLALFVLGPPGPTFPHTPRGVRHLAYPVRVLGHFDVASSSSSSTFHHQPILLLPFQPSLHSHASSGPRVISVSFRPSTAVANLDATRLDPSAEETSLEPRWNR